MKTAHTTHKQKMRHTSFARALRTVSQFRPRHGPAPAAILAASTQLELFDEELCAPNLTVRTLPAPDCRSGDTTQIMARIEAAAAPVLAPAGFL